MEISNLKIKNEHCPQSIVENEYKHGSSDESGREHDTEQPLQLRPGAGDRGECDSGLAAADVPHRGETQVGDGLHELVQNCRTGEGRSQNPLGLN